MLIKNIEIEMEEPETTENQITDEITDEISKHKLNYL